MTQFNINVIPDVDDGVSLSEQINSWRDAIHSSHIGPQRPSYAVAGTVWIDNSVPNGWKIYVYDGANDIPFISSADLGAYLPLAGGTMTGALNIGSTGSDHQLAVRNTAAGVSNDAIVLIQTASTGTTATISGFYFGDNDSASTGQLRYNHSDDSMTFYTSGTEKARLSSGGDLSIGKTGIAATGPGIVMDDSGLIRITREGTVSNTQVQFNNNGGTEVGRIATAGSATSYLTSSDYRLKDNVAPMTGALEKVLALKPCTYKWKSDGSAGQGFIAHELQAVVPDCVTGEKDAVETVDDFDDQGVKIGTKQVPNYQGVDTSFLVATLVSAIQELKAEVEALKAAK